jgi:hypothetical protein
MNMNRKKTLLFVILLLLIGLRYFLPLNGEAPPKELQPIVTSLLEVNRQLEDIMKNLVRLRAAADPAQENFMIMVNDKIEIIKLVSYYIAEDLTAVLNGSIKKTHLPDFSQRLKNDLSFEKARIGAALESIVSIQPLISDRKVTALFKQCLTSAGKILPLFDRSIELLRAVDKTRS